MHLIRKLERTLEIDKNEILSKCYRFFHYPCYNVSVIRTNKISLICSYQLKKFEKAFYEYKDFIVRVLIIINAVCAEMDHKTISAN